MRKVNFVIEGYVMVGNQDDDSIDVENDTVESTLNEALDDLGENLRVECSSVTLKLPETLTDEQVIERINETLRELDAEQLAEAHNHLRDDKIRWINNDQEPFRFEETSL